jgi:hypothetical protein
VHDAQNLAGAFDDGVLGPLGLEQVEHDHGAIGETPAAVAIQRLLVGVEVVDAAERLVERMSGLDDHALDVMPVAVALGIGHGGLLGEDHGGRHHEQRCGDQCCSHVCLRSTTVLVLAGEA